MSSAVIPPPSYGRAIAYGNFRRLDRSAKRGAERPSLHNKRLIVERRSLHSGLRPSVETTGVAIGDSPTVILSAAKDLMPVASGDEILRCAQDDSVGRSIRVTRRHESRPG